MKKGNIPQAIPPAPTTTGMSKGAPLLSVVVEVIVVDDVKSVYCVKVVGANLLHVSKPKQEYAWKQYKP